MVTSWRLTGLIPYGGRLLAVQHHREGWCELHSEAVRQRGLELASISDVFGKDGDIIGFIRFTIQDRKSYGVQIMYSLANNKIQ